MAHSNLRRSHITQHLESRNTHNRQWLFNVTPRPHSTCVSVNCQRWKSQNPLRLHVRALANDKSYGMGSFSGLHNNIVSSAMHHEDANSAHDIAAFVRELQHLRRQVHEQKLELESLRDIVTHNHSEVHHKKKLTKEDYDILPESIILVRHGESQGNVEKSTYSATPDHQVSLTPTGMAQARGAGQRIRGHLTARHGCDDFRMFFMTSPYCRTLQTTELVLQAFEPDQVVGVRQAVQLREQDFGNFQDPQRISADLHERQKFGRFYFRFPNGESGADVYDRLTIFEDHLSRDMMLGRFNKCNLVLVTHGLTMRVFLMRWFHWTVDQFLEVWNPDNAQSVIVEKMPWEVVQELQASKYVHVKHVYAIRPDSLPSIRGATLEMCSYLHRLEQLPRHSMGACFSWMSQLEAAAAAAAAKAGAEMASGRVSDALAGPSQPASAGHRVHQQHQHQQHPHPHQHDNHQNRHNQHQHYEQQLEDTTCSIDYSSGVSEQAFPQQEALQQGSSHDNHNHHQGQVHHHHHATPERQLTTSHHPQDQHQQDHQQQDQQPRQQTQREVRSHPIVFDGQQ